MANIQEIARLAGVSSATVSRVINNQNYVSKETRLKVQKVIDKLDYVPNLNAVSLKKGATKLIGIVAPIFSDSLAVFMRSFIAVAQEHGYNVTLFMTKNAPKKELDALEMLRRKQIDALVLVIRLNDWKTIEHYVKYGPIVTWQRVENENIPSVFMNQYDGYMLGLEHLYAQGFQKIINVYGTTSGLNTQSRMASYQDFCKQKKLNSAEFTHFHNMGTRTDGEKMAHWWLKEAHKPDAFMTPNDAFAAGLITEAKRLNINIPTDFAVCGFDNMEIAHLLNMTTIDYPVDKQAENAFIIIQNQLSTTKLPLKELQFQLIKRLST